MQKPIISADSHITEPPGTYVDRIDAKYKDTAPHMIHDEKLGDVFLVRISRARLTSRSLPPPARTPRSSRRLAQSARRCIAVVGIPTRAWPTRIATASPPRSSTRRSG